MFPFRIIATFVIIYSLGYTKSNSITNSGHQCKKDSRTWTCPDLSDCGKIFGTCVTNDSKESMKTRDILIMVFLIVTIVVCSCAGICCYLVKGKRRPRTTYFSEQRPSSSSISEQASSIFHVNLNTAFEKEISVAEGSNV